MLIGVYLGLLALGFKFFWGPYPFWMAFVVPLGNISETALAYLLFHHFVRKFDPGFGSIRQLAFFILLCPWIPALTSAVSIQMLLQLLGSVPRERFLSEVAVYSLGNATGILLVTPLVTVWRDFAKFRWKSWEGLQLVGLVAIIALAIWFYSDLTPAWMRLVAVGMIPFAVWGVWMTGIRGASLGCLLGSVSYFAFNVPGARPLSQLLEEKQKSAELQFVIDRKLHAREGAEPSPQMARLISDQIGLLTVICITILPLGVASDELRTKANRDRLLMATLGSSFWSWTPESGNEIENKEIASRFLPWAKLFHSERTSGTLKIRPTHSGNSLYLSHWVVQERDVSGKPLRVTGILQNYAAEEERDTAVAQARLAELEIQMLRSHLNPHLLFNCLTGLRGLITENPKKAREFSGSLARFLRAVVDSEGQKTIALKTELGICEDFTRLEELRGRPTSLQIELGSKDAKVAIPPLTLVTLLENATKHGQRQNGGPLRIEITSTRPDTSQVRLQIRQPGTLKSRKDSKNHAGLDLIRRQLAMVFGTQGRLDLSEEPPGMVTATLVLPA